MSLMDLHILAATAAAHLQQTSPAYKKPASWAGGQLDSSATADNGCPSMSDMDLTAEGGGAEAGRSARSSDSHLKPVRGQKNHNHRTAEAKRRERINERLQALRELVPHDQRSNTATFLEGVISYIQDLQHSNAALEAELSSLRALRAAAAASMEQSHQLLAQPAASGSNAANSAQQHAVQQQQQQYYGSSWRQDSITGPPPHSPEAAAAAAAAAHWQQAAAGQMPYDGAVDVMHALQLQQHLQQQQQHGVAGLQVRNALSSSPPLPYGAGPAAAGGPAATTLSAPASLMQSLMQHATSAPAAAGPGVSDDTATPTAAAAAAAGVAPGSLQPPASGGPSGAQPTELQGVLEKALLAALQQQAQQLATQLLSRGS